MISIAKGTQAFSSASQASSLKPEAGSDLSADEAAKLLGSDNADIGEYLNKIANPNYIGNRRVQGTGNNQLGKDDFLKLMLAQMKHQDPTTPLKSHEMAAQMAQFSSLEQLSNINKGIESLAGGQNSGGTYDSLQFIGKVASGDSAKIVRGSVDEKHEFNFNLLNDAAEVKFQIKDAEGNVVKTLEVRDLKGGKNKITWNGITEDGLNARTGEYYFTVDAKNSSGQKVHAETKFEGKISGVRFSPSGPILLVGQQTIRLRDVQQIVDPSLVDDQKSAEAKTLDLKQGAKAQENKNMIGGSVQTQAPKGNIEDVPMARGLINKLEKVTK